MQMTVAPATEAARGRGPLWRSWRRWLVARGPQDRLARAFRTEELSGLSFAFRARSIAVAAVAIWLVAIVPAPRVFYFLAMLGAFFLLGLIPHLFRRHARRRAQCPPWRLRSQE